MRMLSGFLTNVALSVNPDGTYEMFSAEAWSYAGQMTLLGMLMIFSVLGILWGVLALFKVVFAGKGAKKTKKNEVKASTEVVVAQPEAETIENSDDAELVAIITAAISAYIENDGDKNYGGGFRVVSFKRVQSGRSWNSNN